MSTTFPSPDIVIPDLGDFPRIAGEGLDAGTAVARVHYEERKQALETPLAATITRSVAKAHLREHGMLADDFETIDVANIGLRVVLQRPQRRYRVLIWKSPDDSIPAPGRSRARNWFLQMNQLTLNMDIWGAQQEIQLVLTWNASSAFYLTDLFLHMPRCAAESFYQSPVSYWSQKLPLPIEQEKPVPPPDQDEADQLPYEKADEEERKTEEGS